MLNITEPLHASLMLIVAFILIIIAKKIAIYFKKELLNDISDLHSWSDLDELLKSFTCSICDTFLTGAGGKQCDNCGICCHDSCVKLAEKKEKCKDIYTTNETSYKKHHWIKGNLLFENYDKDTEVNCTVCDDECECNHENILQCCWCQKSVHIHCRNNASLKNCDFGKFRQYIIPPSCIIPTKYSRIQRKFKIKCISHPGWQDWTPVFILANRRAGNSDGAYILSYFRRILNPCQVLDLAAQSPLSLLKLCTVIPKNVKCFILVAGGDGTVAWILNIFEKFITKFEPIHSVGIIPLGTGNDLSRILGWGKAYNKNISLSSYLYYLSCCDVVDLDRWQITIKNSRNISIRKTTTSYFYNYFSIGVDAKVALDFHSTRQSTLYMPSRFLNKLLYTFFGTRQAVIPDCSGLQTKLEVYIDNIKIEIPEIESIVIINIPSWAAGVNLWKNASNVNMPLQKIDDGKLEIVGIYSSFHIAQLQIGLSDPLYIGQGSEIQIRLLEKLPIQVDGEPWIQQPAEIYILHSNKVKMLKVP